MFYKSKLNRLLNINLLVFIKAQNKAVTGKIAGSFCDHTSARTIEVLDNEEEATLFIHWLSKIIYDRSCYSYEDFKNSVHKFG